MARSDIETGRIERLENILQDLLVHRYSTKHPIWGIDRLCTFCDTVPKYKEHKSDCPVFQAEQYFKEYYGSPTLT